MEPVNINHFTRSSNRESNYSLRGEPVRPEEPLAHVRAAVSGRCAEELVPAEACDGLGQPKARYHPHAHLREPQLGVGWQAGGAARADIFRRHRREGRHCQRRVLGVPLQAPPSGWPPSSR